MDGDKVIKCPWGRSKVSLKGKTLNENEKMYLAQCINRDGNSCSFIARKYSITKSVIGKYAQSARNGVKLHNTGGKPPILDSISSKALVDYLSNSDENVNAKDFQSLVFDECLESYKRKAKVTGSNCKAFKVSQRTIKKYTDEFMVKSSSKA